MTLPEILKAVRQWWWILILCPLAAGMLAYFGSSSMTPIYESEATALVEHQNADGTQGMLQSIQAAERRTQTFTQLVTSRTVLGRVIEAEGLDIAFEDLRSDVSVSHEMNSQIIKVAVRNPDPAEAALIANAIVDEFATYVEQIQTPLGSEVEGGIDESIEQIQERIATAEARIEELEAAATLTQAAAAELAQLEEFLVWLQESESLLLAIQDELPLTVAATGSQVLVAESAAPSSRPISPRTMLNTVLAAMLGLLIGGAVVVGLSWLDDNVKTEQDIRQILDRPIIGTVPIVDLPDQMENAHAGRSMSGEIFRGLRTNLQFTMVDRNISSIVVTSVGPGEGKTTVAANLAIVLAQGGQRVILIDADMRRPRVHNLFHKVRNDRGLSNLLLQSPAVIEDVVQSTAINNLKVLASGPLPPNPPDLFGSSRMRALVNALEETADIIIFDSPPLAISESLLLSSLADGVLFVVRAGTNRTADVSTAYESVSQTGVPVLGVVLNGVPADSQAAHRVYQQYYPLAGGDPALTQPKRRLGWLGRMFTRGA